MVVTNNVSMLNVGKTSKKSDQEYEERFSNIVEGVSKAKQLSQNPNVMEYLDANLIHFFNFNFRLINEFMCIFDVVFFIAFVWTILTLCGNMLILQLDLVEYKEHTNV